MWEFDYILCIFPVYLKVLKKFKKQTDDRLIHSLRYFKFIFGCGQTMKELQSRTLLHLDLPRKTLLLLPAFWGRATAGCFRDQPCELPFEFVIGRWLMVLATTSYSFSLMRTNLFWRYCYELTKILLDRRGA